MTKEFYNGNALKNSRFFEQYPLWIRDVYRNPTWLSNRAWTFWQYANRGHIAGVQGPVDLNVFFGDTKQWQQFLQH